MLSWLTTKKYRPASLEHRAKLSAAHRRRLGIPDGMGLVYGHLMPQDFADRVRPAIAEVARLRKYAAAHEMLTRLLAMPEQKALAVAPRFVARLHWQNGAARRSLHARHIERLKQIPIEREQRKRARLEKLKMVEAYLMEDATPEQVAEHLGIPMTEVRRIIARR